MEVDVDLSNVLFVCTANERAPISQPLADRVEFISLSGYTAAEKLAIAEKYLLPRCRAEAGLSEEQSRISREALQHVLRWYCREPGVRALERCLQKVLRKIAVRVVQSAWDGAEVGVDALERFLGKRKFAEDRFYQSTQPGVAMGLCWSEMGGSALVFGFFMVLSEEMGNKYVLFRVKRCYFLCFKKKSSLGKWLFLAKSNCFL